jgi:HEAT repeat protein
MRALSTCLVLLASVLLGCAGGEGSRGSGRVRPVEELPVEYATAWRAWVDRTGDWPEWRARVAADPELADFFVDNLVRVLVRSYDGARLSTAQDLPGPFERARRELLFLGERSGPVLVELLVVGDGVVSFLAGDLLVELDDPRLTVAVARKLEAERPEDRRRAAEWLGRLAPAGDGEEEVWRRLRAAVGDPEWFVRAQVALSAGERGLLVGRLDLARPVLVAALADPDRAVQQSACEALRRSRDAGAAPALVDLLGRLEAGGTDLATRRAAQGALESVTGARGVEGADRWRAWLRARRGGAEGSIRPGGP